MNPNKMVLWALFAGIGVAVGACGGEGETPVAGTPAAGAPAAGAPAQPASGGAASVPDQGRDIATMTVLQREIFTYQGAGRDPFLSLLRSGAVRPLLEDLRLMLINFDTQFPMNSVAILRDTTESLRYPVRVGDQLGRLRVMTIREREVVLAYEEFGRELQDTLKLGRTREGSQ